MNKNQIGTLLFLLFFTLGASAKSSSAAKIAETLSAPKMDSQTTSLVDIAYKMIDSREEIIETLGYEEWSRRVQLVVDSLEKKILHLTGQHMGANDFLSNYKPLLNRLKTDLLGENPYKRSFRPTIVVLPSRVSTSLRGLGLISALAVIISGIPEIAKAETKDELLLEISRIGARTVTDSLPMQDANREAINEVIVYGSREIRAPIPTSSK